MPHRLLAAVTSILLASLLCVGSAGAAGYRVVAGSIVASGTDEELPLGGEFEIGLVSLPLLETLETLEIQDFLLLVGAERFGPRGITEFEDLRALEVRILDHLQIAGDAVTFSFFQAAGNGEPVHVDEDGVRFRFLQFRGEGPDAGALVGRLDDGVLPKRIRLLGEFSVIEQEYRFPPEECPIIVLPQPIPLPTPPPYLPGGGGLVITSSTAPDPVRFNGVTPQPTLEELAITAPDGATITYENGLLTIQTSGDLFIDGVAWDLPGLDGVRIETGGDVHVDGTLSLPQGASLFLVVNGAFYGQVDIPPPSDDDPVVVPGPVPAFCNSLLPVFPTETIEAGTYTLELAAVLPARVSVRPQRVVPGSRRAVWVSVHGSEDLDVRDLDVASLRLGVGEAEPATRPSRVRDVDRDGFDDLVVRFEVADAEIVVGDEAVCLSGDTGDGFAIEGCGEIDTTPRARIGRARAASADCDGARGRGRKACFDETARPGRR